MLQTTWLLMCSQIVPVVGACSLFGQMLIIVQVRREFLLACKSAFTFICSASCAINAPMDTQCNSIWIWDGNQIFIWSASNSKSGFNSNTICINKSCDSIHLGRNKHHLIMIIVVVVVAMQMQPQTVYPTSFSAICNGFCVCVCVWLRAFSYYLWW